MPQDFVNNVFDPAPKPYQEPKRTSRPPLEAFGRSAVATAFGNKPLAQSLLVEGGLQTQLAKGNKVARGAGRVIGEGQEYYDTAVQILRLLDSDIPESERANALARLIAPMGVNVAKDLGLAKLSKGKPQRAAALNEVTDLANGPIGAEISNLLTRPMGKGNPSFAQVFHQLGQVIPFTPTVQNIIEMAAQKNVARQPWVKKLKTGLEFATERNDDPLDEDEALLQLMRLTDRKNAPIPTAPGKFFSSNINSPTANANAGFANDVGKLTTSRINNSVKLNPHLEQFYTDPSGKIKKVLTERKGTNTPPKLSFRAPTVNEMRNMQ